MPLNLDEEVRRLRWKCRRGMKELDIVLNRYLDQQYAAATVAEQQAFQALIELEDPVLWTWLLGAEPIPQADWAEVITKMRIKL